MDSEYKYIAEEIRRDIENHLETCGIMCRVFGRGKANESLMQKIKKNPEKYSLNGKKIQDAIGIRVVLYFFEDIKNVKKILSSKYNYREEDSAIDTPKGEEFSVTRYNLIFDCNNHNKSAVISIRNNNPIDTTFEVQIRSVLSEGWHEVEHDMRYKQKSFWDSSPDLSRSLNGIVATLETSEWGMKKIFDDLAYRHYKQKNWKAMLLFKLRLRLSEEFNENLNKIFTANNEVAKKFLRLEREKIIDAFCRSSLRIPVSISNCVFIWNLISANNQEIINLTPNLIIENYKNNQENNIEQNEFKKYDESSSVKILAI